MDRREFLETNFRLAALGLFSGGLLSACTKSKPPVLLGALLSPSHVVSPDGKHTIFYNYDLDRQKIAELLLPLEFPHTAIGHPRKRTLVVVPESGGSRACVVDLVEKRVVKQLFATEGRVFGGHCFFSADGEKLYFSEFEQLPSGKGFVTEWSGEKFELLRQFASGGRFPHDLSIEQDEPGRINVANLGEETGKHVRRSGIFIASIDIATGKVLGRTELNNDPDEMNPVPLEGGDARSRSDSTMRLDVSYFISFMKVAHPQNQRFSYAHSHQPVVSIWSIPKKQLIKEFAFDEQPRALATLPGRSHIAVAMESGELKFIDVRRLQFDDSISAAHAFPVTTHMNAWWVDGAPPMPSLTPAGTYS